MDYNGLINPAFGKEALSEEITPLISSDIVLVHQAHMADAEYLAVQLSLAAGDDDIMLVESGFISYDRIAWACFAFLTKTYAQYWRSCQIEIMDRH
jgi:hypothetical protein